MIDDIDKIIHERLHETAQRGQNFFWYDIAFARQTLANLIVSSCSHEVADSVACDPCLNAASITRGSNFPSPHIFGKGFWSLQVSNLEGETRATND